MLWYEFWCGMWCGFSCVEYNVVECNVVLFLVWNVMWYSGVECDVMYSGVECDVV